MLECNTRLKTLFILDKVKRLIQSFKTESHVSLDLYLTPKNLIESRNIMTASFSMAANTSLYNKEVLFNILSNNVNLKLNNITLEQFTSDRSPCNQNTACVNGGNCVESKQNGFQCACMTPYGGQRCERVYLSIEYVSSNLKNLWKDKLGSFKKLSNKLFYSINAYTKVIKKRIFK